MRINLTQDRPAIRYALVTKTVDGQCIVSLTASNQPQPVAQETFFTVDVLRKAFGIKVSLD